MKSANPSFYLSPKEQDEIMDMYSSGMRICDIVKNTGRSEFSVRRVIANGGYAESSRRKLSAEEELAIERMVFDGLDDATISEVLGLSVGAVKIQRKSIEYFREVIERDRKKRGNNGKYKSKAEEKWLKFFEEGKAYEFGYGNKGKNSGHGKFLYERPMIYRGTYRNALGKLMFVFTSSTGGWTETFTVEQLRDIKVREEVQECPKDTRRCEMPS